MSNAVAHKLMNALIIGPQKTVGEVADALNYARPSLSGVLNGRVSLSIDLALLIEQRFSIPARDLLIMQLDDDLTAGRRKLARNAGQKK
jgi:plasmid maintenance system antidote protein VapI